jgi:NTE family protein
MRRWLQRRPVAAHINLRPTLDSDMARLARILSRQAVGLVLAGGGARGFAHLGVWKALRERGVDIDVVGGTSMGAVMAAVIAIDGDVDHSIAVARQRFRVNPTGDYNWLPIMSLIKGVRARRIVRQSLEQLTGGTPDIVDLWKGYFCIASNYSKGQEMCLTEGDLGQSLLASFAIPGALPPVVREGDLLCDGGTFNNFPANVMRQMRGVGQVIGVDLGARNPRPLDFEEVPGSWTLLRDRLRGRTGRRFRLPSLVSYLLNVTILYSVSRQDESRRLCDVFFSPPLARVGLLQWNRFDSIVRQGYEHALEVLNRPKAAPEEAAPAPAQTATEP